jgi:hypothetical protein
MAGKQIVASAADLLNIYKRAALLKANDERARKVILSGQIAMAYYSYRGQEIIPSVMGELLRDDDTICTIYRGIHDMLGKGFPLRELWAELAGRAHALKTALFEAHFTRGEPLNDPETLVGAAAAAGLSADAARDVLVSGRYADEVRADQTFWREEQDIHAVPAIIFNGKYAILGGQPAATFEKVIRRIVAGEV